MPIGVYKRTFKNTKQCFKNGDKNIAKLPEVRKKLSESKKGKKHWMYGKRGKKCPNWKGGTQRDKHNGAIRYKEWRMAVFIRDNFTCQFCGDRNHIGFGKSINLNAHHIKPWVKYKKLRYDINNGISLCERCHKIAHSKKVGGYY